MGREEATLNVECWALLSGGRVSNAWVTCLIQGDNTGKPVLIPHNIIGRHLLMIKGEIRYKMGPRPIS